MLMEMLACSPRVKQPIPSILRLSDMKCLPIILLSVCLISSVMAESSFKSPCVEKLDRGESQTFVVYGTSLTAGGQWRRQFAAVMKAKYGDKAVVKSGAASGQDSNWGLESIEKRVFPHAPDVLFIEFAMNDAIASRGTSIDKAGKNLETMIEMTLNKFPKCEIILMSMNPDVKHRIFNRRQSGRPKLPEYYAMYAEVARERNLQHIDLFKVWNAFLGDDVEKMKKHIPDGVHPNGLGAQMVITPTILKSIGVEFETEDIPRYEDPPRRKKDAKTGKKQ